LFKTLNKPSKTHLNIDLKQRKNV